MVVAGDQLVRHVFLLIKASVICLGL